MWAAAVGCLYNLEATARKPPVHLWGSPASADPRLGWEGAPQDGAAGLAKRQPHNCKGDRRLCVVSNQFEVTRIAALRSRRIHPKTLGYLVKRLRNLQIEYVETPS